MQTGLQHSVDIFGRATLHASAWESGETVEATDRFLFCCHWQFWWDAEHCVQVGLLSTLGRRSGKEVPGIGHYRSPLHRRRFALHGRHAKEMRFRDVLAASPALGMLSGRYGTRRLACKIVVF